MASLPENENPQPAPQPALPPKRTPPKRPQRHVEPTAPWPRTNRPIPPPEKK